MTIDTVGLFDIFFSPATYAEPARMLRERLSIYRARVRRELTAAFEEECSPRAVAASFAIGIFVTAMPTGGLGISLFFVLVYYWDWVSKTAIFASVAVLNPLVKPLVYVASYRLGVLLLGTEPVVTFDIAVLDWIVGASQVLLIGNVLIALALAGLSYAVVFRLTRAHRDRHHRSDEISPPAALASVIQQWRK